jgi:hypothetical protein
MQIAVLALVVLMLAACEPADPDARSALQVAVLAGPTCPVVSDPPDPDCDDRPVEGAEIIVQDEEGTEVLRMATDAAGTAAVELPPGRYRLVPQPVEGLMGTAPPVTVTVLSGVDAELVTIAYDTGIR